MKKDQSIYRVGVAQPTCAIIHEEYDWELEHQSLVKDDSLFSKPPLCFPNIFGDSAIPDFTCIYLSMDAPIFYHSQKILDVSPSSENREEKLLIEKSLDSSFACSRNIEGEHSCFSSTPLCDSSNHEDVGKNPKFSNRGYHDLSTSPSDHDVDSIIVNPSKALVYSDLFVDEVETP